MEIYFKGYRYEVTFTEKAWGDMSYKAVDEIKLASDALSEDEKIEGEWIIDNFRDEIEEKAIDIKYYKDDII